MASLKCGKCGCLTDTAVAEYDPKSREGVTQCYARLSAKGVGWEKGCAYDEAPGQIKLYIKYNLLVEEDK